MKVRRGFGRRALGLVLALACAPVLTSYAQAPAPAAAPAPASADDSEGAPLPHGADGPPDKSGPAPESEPAKPVRPAPPKPAPDVYAGQVQDTSELDAKRSALADLEKSLTLSKDRVAELKKQVAALQGDAARQDAALIAATERARRAAADVSASEGRLGELISQEIAVRSELDGADADISNLLAALERLSRSPPPALFVDPDDAVASARGASLIAALVPQLREKASDIAAKLAKLGKIRADAEKQAADVKANFTVLEEERLRMATLIAARKKGETAINGELAEAEKQAEALNARADELKGVIAALSARARAVDEAAAAARLAAQGRTPPKLDAKTIRIALANDKRVAPAIPFTEARGYLTLPAKGIDVVDFGQSDGFGGTAKGLSMLTAADAKVVAPADGWVVYKGPYLNYGQIVVLNPGEDYTILLAGLDSVSVKVGDFVRMGEPVGAMGSRTIGRTLMTSAGLEKPTLYIELRKSDNPIDPAGWWAPSNDTESG